MSKTNKIMYEGRMVETIDVTPTWKTAVEIWLTVLENSGEEGKAHAREGLRDMARKFDKVVEHLKKDE